MSLREKFLSGWQFRTRTPTFESGDELTVYVTKQDGETSVARVGDSVLRLTESVPVDTRVRIRVSDFDEDTHAGEASVLDVVGTATF